jgi:drug/metabolite transporter (DMT)-like permease
VLSALYPVATVILAAIVLHERVTRDHTVGIALAAAAIVLIGVGSA